MMIPTSWSVKWYPDQMSTRPSPARERILDAAHDLVMGDGFNATTVDAVVELAGASKGAFFHHFSSKAELGRALIERYAADDAELLDTYMTRAEDLADDPVEQLVAFIRLFEEDADELYAEPGCLFVAFVYEKMPEGMQANDVVEWSIKLWRERILAKLEKAAAATPPAIDVDLPSLADQVFTIFEGAFILAKATGDPGHVPAQLLHLRHYLELLFPRA